MDALNFYKQFIGPDDLVFDVGASVGERTAIFAQLARKVIAVEPIAEPACTEFLRARQKYRNIEVEKCACGEAPGVQPIFFDYSTRLQTASLSPGWIAAMQDTKRFGGLGWNASQNVIVKTLDFLIEKHGFPTFIKIDVEGYEANVLRGLSQPVKALSFEWHPETYVDSIICMERCVELGFTKFAISLAETFKFVHGWEFADQTMARLRTEWYGNNVVYGDVYARC